MKFLNKYLFLLGLVMITLVSLTKSPISVMDGLISKWEERIYGYPQTKIFVHTDKPYYTVGDDVWFSIYATNASDHSAKCVSDLAYVTLEDAEGKTYAKRNIKLDGRFGHGDFKLDEKVPSGKLILKAFTNYMRNYDANYIFSKELVILKQNETEIEENKKESTKKKRKVAFYPEGGELVAGLMSKVAFEVPKSVGSFNIENSKNETILTAKVSSPGIGYFNFTPTIGENYHTSIGGEKVNLPRVLNKGYGLSLNNLNSNFLFIDVSCSEGLSLDGSFIVGHIRGNVFLQQDSIANDKIRLKIDKGDLPSGVAQITLFSKGGKPIAERTFYLDQKENDIEVTSSIPYEYINKRGKADLSISIHDNNNEPVESDFSISVIDNSTIKGIDRAVNIKSYMLLASEFSQHIEDPNQYFLDDSKKTKFLLDLQMMTKGWTRFKWEDLSTLNEPHIDYIPESGFTISGLVLQNGDPVEGQVELVSMDENMITEIIKTNPDGTFRVTGIYLLPNTNLFLKASIPNISVDKEGITDGVKLFINSTKVKNFNSNNIIEYRGESESEVLLSYVSSSKKSQEQDSIYASMFVELEEVSISAKKLSRDQKLRKDRAIVHSHYDARIFMDSIMKASPYKTVFEIVRDAIPGVQVVGNPGFDQRFRFRGGSNTFRGSLDAEVMIDGVRSSIQSLNAINPTMIEFVDVLKGLSSTAIYNAPNGIIAIYTKMGGENYTEGIYSRPEYVAYLTHEGYYFARDFYHPDYGSAFAGSEKLDFRSTLYWNPRVTTKEGDGSVSFFACDNATDYLIEIQGMTNDGRPFVHYDNFEVK